MSSNKLLAQLREERERRGSSGRKAGGTKRSSDALASHAPPVAAVLDNQIHAPEAAAAVDVIDLTSSSAAAQAEWSCEACTLLNATGAAACVACGTSRVPQLVNARVIAAAPPPAREASAAAAGQRHQQQYTQAHAAGTMAAGERRYRKVCVVASFPWLSFEANPPGHMTLLFWDFGAQGAITQHHVDEVRKIVKVSFYFILSYD